MFFQNFVNVASHQIKHLGSKRSNDVPTPIAFLTAVHLSGPRNFDAGTFTRVAFCLK